MPGRGDDPGGGGDDPGGGGDGGAAAGRALEPGDLLEQLRTPWRPTRVPPSDLLE